MSPPRLHVDLALAEGATLDLPAAATRHVQVLRLQPGAELVLFNGCGGEWTARIERIGRQTVSVCLQAHQPVSREAAVAVTLAVGMPANERFDWLIEKATELGVARVQPLVCERSVLRLAGERAQRKQAHWQGIASAAAEQCGRTRLPRIDLPLPWARWLQERAADAGMACWMLSLDTPSTALPVALSRWRTGPSAASLLVLSGPEGGLSPAEHQLAVQQGAEPVSLGPRILRAETAPLIALAAATQAP